MNHPLFKEWLLRLRSGNYAQIQGSLYDGPGQACALGVCGFTIGEARVGRIKGSPSTSVILGKLEQEGIPVSFDDITVLGIDVIRLNDLKGANFAQIADELEKAYYKHFAPLPKDFFETHTVKVVNQTLTTEGPLGLHSEQRKR